jgi:hypothetical protein
MKVSYGVKNLDFVVELRSLLVALLGLLVALSWTHSGQKRT